MIEVYFQITEKYEPKPASKEYADLMRSFKPNQMVRAELYGTKKPRSVLQNRWIHAMFRLVATNTDDLDWDTPEKVKRNVKMAMRFFKDDVVVHGNKVYFELRSFAFDKMDHNEANVRYEDAKNIMAKKLGVDPKELEAEAQKRITKAAPEPIRGKENMKAKEIKCKCGGDPKINGQDSDNSEGPYFVSCKKCGRESLAWAYKREAWKQWKADNKI